MVSEYVHLQGLKSMFQKCLELMKVSAICNSEVVASQRLLMYYKYRILNPCLKFCPL